MKTDWRFLNLDNTHYKETLDVQSLPSPGDGKIHKDRHYTVLAIGTTLVTTPYPLIFAVEHSIK